MSTPHPQAQTSRAADYYVLSLRIVPMLRDWAEVHGVAQGVLTKPGNRATGAGRGRVSSEPEALWALLQILKGTNPLGPGPRALCLLPGVVAERHCVQYQVLWRNKLPSQGMLSCCCARLVLSGLVPSGLGPASGAPAPLDSFRAKSDQESTPCCFSPGLAPSRQTCSLQPLT